MGSEYAIGITASIFYLDHFGSRWQDNENMAPISQRVFPLDTIRDMLMSADETPKEFALIMLRLAVSNGIEDPDIPFLREVFTECFGNETTLIRHYVAKVFLFVAHKMGGMLHDWWLPWILQCRYGTVSSAA
jgi:hypothetical protein